MNEAAARYEKVSWTIEADVLAQVRRRVPRGQQSAYANRALRRQLERDNLEEMIGELVAITGPLDEDAVQASVDEWR
ncbi:MAG: CopG family transcriptional regulator [Micrococcales bacterium]|nr:CopG family transcriptional regulator [Micrococcales bacterium]